MVRAIEGTFQDGRVQLSETPSDLVPSKVVVLFIEGDQPSTPDLGTAEDERRLSDPHRGVRGAKPPAAAFNENGMLGA